MIIEVVRSTGIIREFLRNHDGFDDENVTSKYKFHGFFKYLMTISSCLYYTIWAKCPITGIGTDRFEVKNETERFTVVCPRLVVLTSAGENCSKKQAARAARSYRFF